MAHFYSVVHFHLRIYVIRTRLQTLVTTRFYSVTRAVTTGSNHQSSGWFDYTEPSPTTSLEETAQCRVQGSRCTNNTIKPSLTSLFQGKQCAGCLCNSPRWFKHIEPLKLPFREGSICTPYIICLTCALPLVYVNTEILSQPGSLGY